MNTFFCGAVLNPEGLKYYKGETPAASQWIKGFVQGLEENNANVTVISPIWDSLFPKGHLLPGKKHFLDGGLNQVLVKYINVPYLRTASVAHSVYSAIKKQIKLGNKPDVVVNYNTYPYYISALKKLKSEYPEIKWVNMVLDLDDPEKDNWEKFLIDTSTSDGSVFLSWWGYDNAPIENKLHLDCGWAGKLPDYNDNISENIFIYAGKYAKFGGIDELIDAIKAYDNPSVKFYFFGKDEYPALESLQQNDSRVKIFGFVTDDFLDEVCLKAKAFLSPREINFQGTKMIFPSKILFYLKYRKPIISAMLPGLSADYSDLLIKPETNDVNGWIKAFNQVMAFKDDNFRMIERKSLDLLSQKSWKNQAERFINYVVNNH